MLLDAYRQKQGLLLLWATWACSSVFNFPRQYWAQWLVLPHRLHASPGPARFELDEPLEFPCSPGPHGMSRPSELEPPRPPSGECGLYFSNHSPWVRSSFPMVELDGGVTSSSALSEDFSVTVISSIESFERSTKASDAKGFDGLQCLGRRLLHSERGDHL